MFNKNNLGFISRKNDSDQNCDFIVCYGFWSQQTMLGSSQKSFFYDSIWSL